MRYEFVVCWPEFYNVGNMCPIVFQQKARGHWFHWNDLIRGHDLFAGKKIREILVPTMDTARYKFLMDACIENES